MQTRCNWADAHPLLTVYHDQEWGVLTRDRSRLFEFLLLEGAQAGLAWLSILARREGYRQAFCEFIPERVAQLSASQEAEILNNPRIIRNRAKVSAAVNNARRFLEVEEAFGGFDRYLDEVTAGPARHHFLSTRDVPSATEESAVLSRDLMRRGFRFVGPTICYSYLEAVGWAMDHVVTCFRYRELEEAANPQPS